MTHTWLKLTQAETCPMVWNSATGMRANMRPRSTCGFGCRPVTHSTTMNIPLATVHTGRRRCVRGPEDRAGQRTQGVRKCEGAERNDQGLQ